MPNLIILRLHPVEPTTGADFTNYLEGLSITAYDLSYKHPGERDLSDENKVGQARYLPLDPAQNRIIQHGVLGLQAVATAVIEVNLPADYVEYKTHDIRLVIERHDKKIVDRNIDYNVAVIPYTHTPPLNLGNYVTESASIYVALPAQNRGLNPDDAYVDLPSDGTPPNFGELRDAVKKVLEKDPDNVPTLNLDQVMAQLTPAQSRHIANEIVWNRDLYPPPTLPRSYSLEEMYTGPHSDTDEVEQYRKRFEGELQSYYATRNAEADRLARYIYSLSAAISCENMSRDATRVRFQFPVIASNTTPTMVNKAAVILTNVQGSAIEHSFVVPAEYFYALGVDLMPQVTSLNRYKMAYLENEQQVLTILENAIDTGTPRSSG